MWRLGLPLQFVRLLSGAVLLLRVASIIQFAPGDVIAHLLHVPDPSFCFSHAGAGLRQGDRQSSRNCVLEPHQLSHTGLVVAECVLHLQSIGFRTHTILHL